MAKDQRNVEAITPMEEDFAKWYTDICLKAELVDYASVKGFLILRPYGYAIWENIQKYMDAEFKKTGHVNVAMPVLIPESLLKKEGELVAGFAPEVAWVTHGGSEQLEERLAFRPTSETMFCDHWSHVLHSYRELPMLYNQWCSVIRWEKTTRPFLRSREFWWQEGHTIHETAEEAMACLLYTSPSASTPRPTPPSRTSISSATPCSPTSAAPWWRSWATRRAIWRSMWAWPPARPRCWCPSAP